MSNWFSTIYKACIIAGIISFVLGLFTTSGTSLGAFIAGYSVVILAILLILIVSVNTILTINGNDSISEFLSSVLITNGPFLFILSIITFVLSLLIKYQSNIIDDNTAPGYNSYSNIIVILSIIQLCLIYRNITNEKFNTTGKLSAITSSLIYLIGVITAMNSIMLYRILEYYSTDGFTITNFAN
jgi:hypothetical protein